MQPKDHPLRLRAPLALALCCVLGLAPLGGCKKRQAPVPVPTASPSTRPTGDPQQTEDTTPHDEEQEALRLLGPVEEPDSGAPNAGAAGAPGPAGGGIEGPSEEELAAQARKATEAAVDAAFSRAGARLKACFDRAGTGAVSGVELDLRVHRLGYVIDVQVRGAPGEVGNCLAGVLKNARVSGVQTDDAVSVTRRLSFK